MFRIGKRGRPAPWLIGAGAVIGSIALVLLAVVLLWDWNWLRSLVERQASQRLDRPVAIGNFDIQGLMSREPWIILDSIIIGNPPDFPAGPHLGTIQRLSLRVDLPALIKSWGNDIVLPAVIVDRPEGDLRRGPNGDPNWTFGSPASTEADSRLPKIGALVINEGNFRVTEPSLNADFTVAVHTESPPEGGEDRLVAKAQGTYDGQPITADFSGGALLSLRDASQPYPVDLSVANGATSIVLKGTVQDPLNLTGANLELELVGNDLADLYALIAIPLPPTPPFRLKGQLDYAEGAVRFRDFAGTVGQSDLGGHFDVQFKGRKRPFVTANLFSTKVVLADIAGFIGGTPGTPDAANDTPELKARRAIQRANPKLIPDIPIDLAKLRSADFRIVYVGQHIESASTPFDNLHADLSIEDGKVTLLPLSFGVGQSEISANITLDANEKDLVLVTADIDFQRLDLSYILQKLTDLRGDGFVGGEAHIVSTGNSLAQMLARGNGDLKMSMGGGDVSAFLVHLAGLDLGRAVLSWLGLPERAPLRCMVSDFALENGILQTRTLLVDTTEANLIGNGRIDLRDETVGMEIKTQPKHASIGRLPLPIDISGPLKSPTVKPGLRLLSDGGPAAAVLALLTIQLGSGKDNDCAALMSATRPRTR